MVRILETNVDDQGYGGVYAFNLNVIKTLQQKNKDIQFSICAFEPFENATHVTSLEKDGVQVYNCWGGQTNFLFKQFRTCLKFWSLLHRESIDVVHIHSDVAYKLFLYALVAVMGSNARVLVHSHSTNIEGEHKVIKRYLQYLCRYLLRMLPVIRLACSEAAANWMYDPSYNKKAILIKNGIDSEKFRFNPQVREIERKKLGINNETFLIGTVGRFSPPKKPEYLLHVFEIVYNKYHNARLLWVGEGDMKPEIIAKAKKRGIDGAIIFYGTSDCVERLYQAMDCFILPSRFEGLGIVVIEAQAAGLPCIVSDQVPKEAKITDLVEFLPLNNVNNWLVKIEKKMHISRPNTQQKIVEAGYDLYHEIGVLERIYCQKL